MDVVANSGEVLSYASERRAKGSRIAAALLMLAWIYPLLPLIGLYATWLIAWWMLWHRPRSSIDDPKFIGGPVDAAYVATALLLMSRWIGVPVGLWLGLIASMWGVHSRRRSWKLAGLLSVMLVGFYAGCSALIVWDPLRVLYWYMD